MTEEIDGLSLEQLEKRHHAILQRFYQRHNQSICRFSVYPDYDGTLSCFHPDTEKYEDAKFGVCSSFYAECPLHKDRAAMPLDYRKDPAWQKQEDNR